MEKAVGVPSSTLIESSKVFGSGMMNRRLGISRPLVTMTAGAARNKLRLLIKVHLRIAFLISCARSDLRSPKSTLWNPRWQSQSKKVKKYDQKPWSV